jgi:outer membrane protein OmpA-like peptidoglycan-associated protein
MFRATGPGKHDRKENGPNDWTVNLYNFDVQGDQLKEDHTDFLTLSIVPRLRAGGGVTIMGIADATGDESFNQALSERRANNLLAFLRS